MILFLCDNWKEFEVFPEDELSKEASVNPSDSDRPSLDIVKINLDVEAESDEFDGWFGKASIFLRQNPETIVMWPILPFLAIGRFIPVLNVMKWSTVAGTRWSYTLRPRKRNYFSNWYERLLWKNLLRILRLALSRKMSHRNPKSRLKRMRKKPARTRLLVINYDS